MSRPWEYEIWLGEGRGSLLSDSLEGAKAILRRHFQGPVFLSDEYRTPEGIGFAAYPSAKARAADSNGARSAYAPSIERFARRAVTS